MFRRKAAIFAGSSIIENLKKLKEQTINNSLRKAFAELPVAVMSAALIGTVIVTSAAGYNLYDSAAEKVSQLRMARALADDETERIRSAGYDDIVKIEKPNGKLQNGYVKEIALGKEYREDIGNSVLKHKPVTINVYDAESNLFPLVSIKTEKVSRWYKSGTFDKSNNGIYDETGEQHKGTIKKTGNGTGYVFLKKGAKVNGDVEIYDETNGDIYISNSIGTPGKKTLVRHVGPATASGYIRLAEGCKINGTVTLENSSNGGLIIETNLQDGMSISKTGTGTGYLKLESGSWVGKKVKVSNESSGAIILKGNLYSESTINRTGNSDGLLITNKNFSLTSKSTLNIEMDNSGKVELSSQFKSCNMYYSSNTNKTLALNWANLGDNIRFINNSNGKLKFDGTIPDNGEIIYCGTGSGYLSFAGIIEGKGIIENNTKGNINIDPKTILHNGKRILKIGGGTGYLDIGWNIDLKGDLTLDHDGSGYFIISGNINATTKEPFYPSFVDGAYIKVIGKNYGGTQLGCNSDILGTVIFDYRNNPADHTSIGYTPYDSSRTALKDGFTYTSRKEY